ncbi:MAG: hypothetical protein IPK12_24450 [Gemmatimonadetes bacterium]|nr:hypothetical protein [Gemmatimonadota bacterium]
MERHGRDHHGERPYRADGVAGLYRVIGGSAPPVLADTVAVTVAAPQHRLGWWA